MKAARQQTIVDLLSQHKSLTTEALAVQLNVSKETICRDISELQKQGKVLRNHGRVKGIERKTRTVAILYILALRAITLTKLILPERR